MLPPSCRIVATRMMKKRELVVVTTVSELRPQQEATRDSATSKILGLFNSAPKSSARQRQYESEKVGSDV